MIFLFSTVNSKMSRNMCKLCHKVRNSHFYPMKVQISSISKVFFLIEIFILILGFQKRTASIRLLKNTLGLYVFKNLKQETQI